MGRYQKKVLPNPSPSDKLAIIELKVRELECQIKALFIALKENREIIIASNANAVNNMRREVTKIVRDILTERLEDQSPAIRHIVEYFERQGYSFVKRPDPRPQG